jgi:probable rRNA maturation factor
MSIIVQSQQRLARFNLDAVTQLLRRIIDQTPYAGWGATLDLCGEHLIARLNLEYRQKPFPTDVLSFPMHQAISPGQLPKPLTDEHKNLGCIYVAVPYVGRYCWENWNDLSKEIGSGDYPPRPKRNDMSAPAFSHYKFLLERRLKRLYVHSVCHLMGYDHVKDDEFEEVSYPRSLEDLANYRCLDDPC